MSPISWNRQFGLQTPPTLILWIILSGGYWRPWFIRPRSETEIISKKFCLIAGTGFLRLPSTEESISSALGFEKWSKSREGTSSSSFEGLIDVLKLPCFFFKKAFFHLFLFKNHVFQFFLCKNHVFQFVLQPQIKKQISLYPPPTLVHSEFFKFIFDSLYLPFLPVDFNKLYTIGRQI